MKKGAGNLVETTACLAGYANVSAIEFIIKGQLAIQGICVNKYISLSCLWS